MKKLNKILLTLLLFFPFNSFSQSVDEIIDNYFENTGGIDQWRKLKGVKMSAKLKVNQCIEPMWKSIKSGTAK